MTDWWFNANVVCQVTVPAWCNGKGGKGYVTLSRMIYDLSHELILDIQDFVTSGEYRTRKVGPERPHYVTFFAALRSPEQRVCAPYPQDLHLQPGTHTYRPFQCLRQLALIELVGVKYTELPKDHSDLVQRVSSGGQVRFVNAGCLATWWPRLWKGCVNIARTSRMDT